MKNNDLYINLDKYKCTKQMAHRSLGHIQNMNDFHTFIYANDNDILTTIKENVIFKGAKKSKVIKFIEDNRIKLIDIFNI